MSDPKKEENIKEKETKKNEDKTNKENINFKSEKEEYEEKLDIEKFQNAYISKLENEIREIQKREIDVILRSKAEIENIRKLKDQDIKKFHKFALEKFFIELLPVIDNLERAIEMTDKKNNDLKSTIEGVELTLKSLLNVVQKFGIEIIKDINVPFNPTLHQAMTMIDLKNDQLPNQVVLIIQKGYILNGRLIRPAMVGVSKEKI